MDKKQDFQCGKSERILITAKPKERETVLLDEYLAGNDAVSIVVEKHAYVTLEHQCHDNVSKRIELHIADGAKVIFNQNIKHSNERLALVCYLQKDAQFIMRGNYHAAIALELSVLLQAAGAHAEISLAVKTSNEIVTSFITKQKHEAPHTKSSLQLKGLLKDKARSRHDGLIHISLDAMHAEADLESRYMLLGDKVQACSVPSLEALTDQVHCSHASAIGRFEEEEMFYLMSRGLSDDVVEEVLAEAFFNS